MCELNFKLIERASLCGHDLLAQADFATGEINRQLRVAGFMNEPVGVFLQPREFELGISASYDHSYGSAIDIAGQINEGVILVRCLEVNTYFGQVVEVTEHHVVQDTGRTAGVHEIRNLDRVPVKGGVLSIIYDGNGQGRVGNVVPATVMPG